MKDSFPERLDPQSIRRGLLSIRNSQIQLLNQLKIETQQLKKTPVRASLSPQNIKQQQRSKANEGAAKVVQKGAFQVKTSLNASHLPIQKPRSSVFQGEKQLESQVSYLKDQNKRLNQTIQKLLHSRSGDKQRARQLQNYLYFSQKAVILLVNQFSSNTLINQIKRSWENDLQLNQDIYQKYQQSNHIAVLQVLKERQSQPSSDNPKERDMAQRLRQLKDQLAILLKNSHQKNDNTASIQIENIRLREQEEIIAKKCEEMQKRIIQLDSDNKELAMCWDREITQRKLLIAQLQKMRKKMVTYEEKQKVATGLQKDLQYKLANTHKLLKDRQTNEGITMENAKKLTDAIAILTEQNDKLRREVKSFQQSKSNTKKQQQSIQRQVQNELRGKLQQQAAMMRNYQQQIYDLRSHLGEVKKNQEMLLQGQVKQKENEIAMQEIYWRKVNAIKTNSTVQHLWQVKNAEYDNLGALLRQLSYRRTA